MKKLVVLIIALFLFSSGNCQIQPLSSIKKLKTCQDRNIFEEVLKQIGTPDSIIKEYSEITLHNSQKEKLHQMKFLNRAETFKVNLDKDSNFEYVSQLIFVYISEPVCHDRYLNDGISVYYIYVFDDSTEHNKLLSFQCFNEIIMNDNKPMTFSFIKTAQNYSRIIFNIEHIESCGVWEFSSYKQTDTLAYENEVFKYKSGLHYDVVYQNIRKIIEDQ